MTCNSVYIGKTISNFSVRISKHRDLTNRQLLSPLFNRNHNHPFEVKPNNFKIIAFGQNNLELLIKKLILTKLIKPNIGVKPLKLNILK